jgi:hypothetical protein
MKNLAEALCASGFSEDEAKKVVVIVYDWVAENYPVLAAVAKNTVMKEVQKEVEEGHESG